MKLPRKNKAPALKMIAPAPLDEEAECMTFYAMCERHFDQYPELAWIYHVPNGGQRTKTQAVRFQRMGVLPGVEDYALDVARLRPGGGIYCGWRAEMKRESGKPPRPEQYEMMRFHAAQGYRVKWFKGYKGMLLDVLAYLALHRPGRDLIPCPSQAPPLIPSVREPRIFRAK